MKLGIPNGLSELSGNGYADVVTGAAFCRCVPGALPAQS